MSHNCHAEGCQRSVPPRMFACLAHWRALPSRVQRAIWTHYRPGQERDKGPSAAYMAVQQYAVAWLANHEGREQSWKRAVFEAVAWEARAREGGTEPLAGLQRFWEDAEK